MRPVDRVGPVARMDFALGNSYEKFQRGFRDEKKVKDCGEEIWRQIQDTKQTW